MNGAPDPADLEAVPRPVVALARDFPAGHVIQPHRHRRAQLIFASRGAMTVSAARSTWVVPPNRAVWMTAGTAHGIRMAGPVAMRTLYVDPAAAPGLPAACCVLTVSPLLRELILAAMDLPRLYAVDGPEGRLVAVLLDQLRVLPTIPLHLPMPTEPRLRTVTAALAANPGDGRSIEAWARLAGASGRTLARLFQRETGMSFAAWRQQARLLAALGRLAAGQTVTTVALDLGYESPSAFIAMFRRALGTTPSRYFQDVPVPLRRAGRTSARSSGSA